MRDTSRRGVAAVVVAVCAGAAAAAQAPAAGAASTITIDVMAPDASGTPISDLARGELEVYEDGVRKAIESLVFVRDGQATDGSGTPGHLFFHVVDDLNLDFRTTPHTRELVARVLDAVVRDGDLVGMVSTGPSAAA